MTSCQPCKLEFSVDYVRELYHAHQTHYSKVIAKTVGLVPWMQSQLSFNTDYIPEMVFALLNPEKSAICGDGKKRRFRNINIGWLGCGNRSCQSCISESIEKSKMTNLQRYGVENPMQNAVVKDKCVESNKGNVLQRIEKTKRTNLDRYGVDHYWKTKEGQDKRRASMLSRYGVENPSSSLDIRDKRNKTFDERFNGHPMKNQKIKDDLLRYFQETYNTHNPSCLPEVRARAKQTMKDRYGVEHALLSDEFKIKSNQTMQSRYGVDSVMHDPVFKDKAVDNKKQCFFNGLIDRNRNLVTPLFSLDQYVGVGNEYPWQCNVCGLRFVDHLDDGWVPRCTKCHPVVKSQGEQQLYEYIKTITNENVIRNSRSIISPLELDIYLPDKQLAIEFNGVYHHSEISGRKPANYHLEKYQLCRDTGIRLVQIFDVEWYKKQQIVKSKLSHLLGLSTKIYARKCDLREINSSIKSSFLDANHMQGDCVSTINYGLFFQGELVAVMTFGSNRFSKKSDWELIRYCTKNNTTVIGGASKLLHRFETALNSPSMISYCDLRYGTGGMYESLGFTKISKSSPNYWYHSDNRNLESRIKYQKHKLHKILSNFDPEKTEWNNMQAHGYDRIWDCGSLVFLKNAQDRP